MPHPQHNPPDRLDIVEARRKGVIARERRRRALLQEWQILLEAEQ